MNNPAAPYPLRAKALLLLLSIVVSTAIFEAALRASGVQYPYFTHFTEADPVLGFALRPGASGWQTNEGNADVQINSRGMRDHEHAVEKPAGTLRIAVLGDSVAEAPQVPVERTFWAVAERELSASCPALGGRTPEFLNFGVSGFSNLQELLLLRERVWEFDPDIVLLSFFSGNDLRENIRTHAGAPYRPNAVWDGHSYAVDNSFRETMFFRFRSSALGDALLRVATQSRVLQVINKARLVAARKKREWQQEDRGPEDIGLDSSVYLPPANDDQEIKWLTAEAILSDMAQEVHARGARFAVAVATNGSQVHPFPETRKRYEGELSVPDLFYPERRIAALGEREGFPVLALAPALQKEAEEEQLFLHGFPNTELGTGHWNTEGHRAAGGRLAAFLCSSILP